MPEPSRLTRALRRNRKGIRQAVSWIFGRGSKTQVAFLGGVQRSGTNMIMDVLDRSPDTKVYDESDHKAFAEFELRDDPLIQQLVQSSMAPCVVFKAICDNDRLKSLLDRFDAAAAAIWMYRHYEGVVASHLARWPTFRNKIDRLVADRSAADWRGRGMTDETWELVREHHRPDASVATSIALFWYYRNQLFFDQQLDRDSRAYLLRYEQTVADPSRELRQLSMFLGIKMVPRMIDGISSMRQLRSSAHMIDPPVAVLCEMMLHRLDSSIRYT